MLDFITPHVKPGVTTGKLNDLCHDYMVEVQGTIPAPLNYAPPGYTPFPKSICTSVNHLVCHGIPGDKVLKKGDIAQHRRHRHQGRLPRRHQPHVLRRRAVHPGAAPGARSPTNACGSASARSSPGARLGDIGAAIQAHAEKHGFSVVREFCGHGIGRKFHEEPQVLHYGKPGTG